MIKSYVFSGEAPILFDDSKSVRELIAYAFLQFDYYEPAGIDIVTVFQYYHSNSYNGWLTTDTSRACSEEIENSSALCFAYYKPGCFYFAEGGWGHHMKELGNHPELTNPVSIHLRFDDFNHTVVINGNYSFGDVINYLKKTGYISRDLHTMEIIAASSFHPNSYVIDFTDNILSTKLTDFENKIEAYTKERLSNKDGFIYHYIFNLE